MNFTRPEHAFTDAQPLQSQQSALSFPDDTMVLAIGDIHGQKDGFVRALELANRFRDGDKQRVLVLTGDLIDRGPDSLGCLRLAAEAQDTYGFDSVVYLPGNHELLMLDALEEMETHNAPGSATDLWLANGGYTMLAEIRPINGLLDQPNWPMRAVLIANAVSDWRGLAADITAQLPDLGGRPYRLVLRGAPSHVRIGDVVFLHAGVDPDEPMGVALNRAQQLHLSCDRSPLGFQHHACHWAWTRNAFLYHTGGWRDGQDTPLLMVHGHTAAQGADIGWLSAPNTDLLGGLDHARTHGRICIDGGAYRGDLVAGVAFTHNGYRVFAAPCT